GLRRQLLWINILGKRLALQVHLEYLLTTHQVGLVYRYLPVETAGPEQGRIQDIGTVCSCQDDDPAIGAKSIHLRQKLVEGILTLIVGAADQVLAPGTTYRVDFVNEDDAGRFFLGLPEQVAHPGSTHADKHFYEIGARQ